jgi:hypothetical protein
MRYKHLIYPDRKSETLQLTTKDYPPQADRKLITKGENNTTCKNAQGTSIVQIPVIL